MNVKFTNIDMVAMKIPSQRAQPAPEKTPKPAARPIRPPTGWIHPQVLALVVI
jgi:hypothetical protein